MQLYHQSQLCPNYIIYSPNTGARKQNTDTSLVHKHGETPRLTVKLNAGTVQHPPPASGGAAPHRRAPVRDPPRLGSRRGAAPRRFLHRQGPTNHQFLCLNCFCELQNYLHQFIVAEILTQIAFVDTCSIIMNQRRAKNSGQLEKFIGI